MTTHPDAYRSKHLVYRAIEDTPEDMALVNAIQNDAGTYARSNFTLMKPQGAQDLMEAKRGLAEMALLGVVICLPSPATTTDPGPPSLPGKQPPARAGQPIPIGAIGLSPSQPGHGHHRESFVSVSIVRGYRGQGHGSEALRWVLQWGFQIAGLHRISIESFAYNEGAGRLYDKLGFVLEGRKRKCIWFNGEWHDQLTYGMLEDEWRVQTGARKFESPL